MISTFVGAVRLVLVPGSCSCLLLYQTSAIKNNQQWFLQNKNYIFIEFFPIAYNVCEILGTALWPSSSLPTLILRPQYEKYVLGYILEIECFASSQYLLKKVFMIEKNVMSLKKIQCNFKISRIFFILAELKHSFGSSSHLFYWKQTLAFFTLLFLKTNKKIPGQVYL